jgi:hypothetical protein
MKFILLVGLVFLFSAAAAAQIADGPVRVEEIYLARDNGEGKAGDPVEAFAVSDIPIHCVVTLDSLTPTTVKMNFVAVSVKGVKAETQVFTVSYKTNGNQNQVTFRGKPDGKSWVAGSYRIDIFVDGKPAGSKTFPIGAPTAISSTQTNFADPKPKPKPRRSKKP